MSVACLLLNTANASEGFFIGASVGNSKIDIGTTQSSSSLGFEFGYQMNEHFKIKVASKELGALEFYESDFLDFGLDGSVQINAKEELAADALALSFQFIAPVSDNFSVNAEVGYSSWKVDSTFSANAQGVIQGQPINDSFSEKERVADGNDPFYALGLAYAFSNVEVELSYNFWELDDADIKETELTLSYHF